MSDEKKNLCDSDGFCSAKDCPENIICKHFKMDESPGHWCEFELVTLKNARIAFACTNQHARDEAGVK